MMIRYMRYRLSDGSLERAPLVFVNLTCNRKRQKVLALIDSGSAISVANCEIAQLLDVDVRTGHPYELNGIEGGHLPAWTHQVNIAIEGLGYVNTVIAFTEVEAPDWVILGERGFFDAFQVRFKRYKDEVELYPKDTTF